MALKGSGKKEYPRFMGALGGVQVSPGKSDFFTPEIELRPILLGHVHLHPAHLPFDLSGPIQFEQWKKNAEDAPGPGSFFVGAEPWPNWFVFQSFF